MCLSKQFWLPREIVKFDTLINFKLTIIASLNMDFVKLLKECVNIRIALFRNANVLCKVLYL